MMNKDIPVIVLLANQMRLSKERSRPLYECTPKNLDMLTSQEILQTSHHVLLDGRDILSNLLECIHNPTSSLNDTS